MAQDLEVVIVSYNTRADTLACLASLFAARAGRPDADVGRGQRVE